LNQTEPSKKHYSNLTQAHEKAPVSDLLFFLNEAFSRLEHQRDIVRAIFIVFVRIGIFVPIPHLRGRTKGLRLCALGVIMPPYAANGFLMQPFV
jgi:hypothetical protein